MRVTCRGGLQPALSPYVAYPFADKIITLALRSLILHRWEILLWFDTPLERA